MLNHNKVVRGGKCIDTGRGFKTYSSIFSFSPSAVILKLSMVRPLACTIIISYPMKAL